MLSSFLRSVFQSSRHQFSRTFFRNSSSILDAGAVSRALFSLLFGRSSRAIAVRTRLLLATATTGSALATVAPIVALASNLEGLEIKDAADGNEPAAEINTVPPSSSSSSSSSSNSPTPSEPHEDLMPDAELSPATPASRELSPVSCEAPSPSGPLMSKAVDAGAAMVPHPEKAHKNGEDAYLISEHRRILAVADGVGGWAELHVDPSLFSRGLCACVAPHASEALDADSEEAIREAVQRAYDDICDKGIEGSSTLCTAFLYPGHLICCNLGDSGLRLIRGDEVVYRTQEQVHQFNFPYQLGSRGRGEAEHPCDAMVERVPIQAGDVIVMGSDGLFDNVFDAHIVKIVRDNIDKSAEEIASEISRIASQAAGDPTAETPFAHAAADHNLTWFGGKLDDITVVVAKV